MNFTVSGVSYFLATSRASLMAAPLGMSGIYKISYMATRMMAEATSGMRAKLQPLAYLAIYPSSSAAWTLTPLTSLRIYSACLALGVSA